MDDEALTITADELVEGRLYEIWLDDYFTDGVLVGRYSRTEGEVIIFDIGSFYLYKALLFRELGDKPGGTASTWVNCRL